MGTVVPFVCLNEIRSILHDGAEKEAGTCHRLASFLRVNTSDSSVKGHEFLDAGPFETEQTRTRETGCYVWVHSPRSTLFGFYPGMDVHI